MIKKIKEQHSRKWERKSLFLFSQLFGVFPFPFHDKWFEAKVDSVLFFIYLYWKWFETIEVNDSSAREINADNMNSILYYDGS